MAWYKTLIEIDTVNMITRWLTNINECRVDEEKDDRRNDVDELVDVDYHA